MPEAPFGLRSLNVLRPILEWAQGKLAPESSWRAFVSWQAYYAAYLGADARHALIQHGGPHVGDPARQIELIDALAAARGPVVVRAPPGCGKSRFALELARRIERDRGRWQVVFVRHDETAVREELQQLAQLKRVVFIVDDAHECPELVSLIAATCAQAPAAASLCLVCLTRSTGRAQVSRALNDPFPAEAVREIDLGRPSPQLVRSLIDQLLPQSSPHHRDTIARFVRQSYFGAVLVCSMLSRESRLPQTFQRNDLRERICRELLRNCADGICPVETALRALSVYAALAPISGATADVREWAARSSGLTPPAVESLIDRALRAGLLQEYGHSLMRPLPDTLGDLILETACLDAYGKPTPFSAQLLEQLLEAEPAAAARNCADIGLLFGAAEDVDLISRTILERARTIPAGNQWDVLKLMQTAQPLAACRPATVVEMAGILEARGILRREAPAGELIGSNSIEMGACTLLMSAGETDLTAVPIALGLGRDLYTASREDARSGEHVLDKLAACCRFEAGRSLAHAQAVADTLRTWVDGSDVGSTALAVSLSAQFLTLEAASGARSPLSPQPEVWAVRNVATDTVTRGMAHADAAVQCSAIESLEHYADCEGTADQAWTDLWLPQLTREMERLSAAIIRTAKEAATPLRVLAAAELRGWHWWARQEDVLHRAGVTILQAIPDSDAYRLWKLVYALPLPVRTALPEPTLTEPQHRLEYVQALSTAREEETAAQARQLFDALDPRYPDIAAWRALWLVVLEQPPRMAIHPHTGVVAAEFARRHPEVAWSFVNRADADGPLFAVLPFLLAELGKLDKARRSREAGNVPRGTRLEEAWLRALSFTSDFDEPERAILARGLESADSDTVHHAADALLAAGTTDRLGAFRRVFSVITNRPTDSELWELTLQRFVDWAEVVLPPRLAKPTDETVRAADGLLTLLQTQGSHLRWGFQRHTRKLANALAIFAVVCPRRLQEWMQREWGRAAAAQGKWSDESPLSMGRLAEIMRLIADSPAATQWIETFLGWIRHDPQLGGAGAIGLAELCSTEDSRVSELAQAIGAHPTDASQKALAEFVNQRKRRERPVSGESLTGSS